MTLKALARIGEVAVSAVRWTRHTCIVHLIKNQARLALQTVATLVTLAAVLYTATVLTGLGHWTEILHYLSLVCIVLADIYAHSLLIKSKLIGHQARRAISRARTVLAVRRAHIALVQLRVKVCALSTIHWLALLSHIQEKAINALSTCGHSLIHNTL